MANAIGTVVFFTVALQFANVHATFKGNCKYYDFKYLGVSLISKFATQLSILHIIMCVFQFLLRCILCLR